MIGNSSNEVREQKTPFQMQKVESYGILLSFNTPQKLNFLTAIMKEQGTSLPKRVLEKIMCNEEIVRIANESQPMVSPDLDELLPCQIWMDNLISE